MFDIPAAHYQGVEYRTLQLRCTCGREHVSAFPSGVTEAVQYGANVRALGVHLTQGQLLPYSRASQLIADLFHLEVSPATLLSWVDDASELLLPSVGQIAQALIEAPVAHADESGLRVAGKLHWLHTVATSTHTGYGVHAKRGGEAIKAQGILPKRIAVLVHDCWKPYWQLDCVHALCNAPLLRELVFVRETTGQTWNKHMIDLLLDANKTCEAARQQNEKTLAPGRVKKIPADYQALLREGEAAHPETPRTVV